MSLADLTRNSFQSGLSSHKWLGLSRLFLSKAPPLEGSGDPGSVLSNSVLVLFRTYPGDPALLEYLRCAIREGMISFPVFVAQFLQAARSIEMQNSASLDMLCRLALDAHYASASSPVPAAMPYSLSQITLLDTVQDALGLLRTAYMLPASHFHHLTSSASELLILLLSSITDLSQISTAQAMILFADVHDMLQTIRLSPDVRQVLDNFALSLSLLIGDDAKIAREAQMMHTVQMALGKGDFMGSTSDTDLVTCSLVLNSLVSSRAGIFSSGNDVHAVAVLVGTFRWSLWTPIVFYTQLLLSALTYLAQFSLSIGPNSTAVLWRAFVIGRMPRLLALFEKAVKSDPATDADWRGALQGALGSIFRRTDLQAECDRVSSRNGSVDATQNLADVPGPTYGELTKQLLINGLVDQVFVLSLDSSISNYNSPLSSEAQEAGHDIKSFLDAKLTSDSNPDDICNLLNRILHDPMTHAAFSEVVLQRFVNLGRTFDVEPLSHLCNMLDAFKEGLDIVALHIKLSDLLFHALAFLEDYDCETVGDPQTAVAHLGEVVLFLQKTLTRFNLDAASFTVGDRTITADLIRAPAATHAFDSLAPEEAAAFKSWFKALFDSSSEGIEDTILRSTRPKVLLRICATLFSHAISACAERQIDADVLNNGVSYFSGPLLNWTLVGVIKALTREVQVRGFQTPVHLEIIQTLFLSPTCPRPVLFLCSSHILRVLRDVTKRRIPTTAKFDFVGIHKAALQSLQYPESGSPAPLTTSLSAHPRHLIQTALNFSQTGKAPSLSVSSCLLLLPPLQFLQLLWGELSLSASLGELETCRRLGTFVLTAPSTPPSPPLLPIFLHVLVPSLITSLDATAHPPGPEQTLHVELLVALISSSLTRALHLDYALRAQAGHPAQALSMARKLAADLRARRASRGGMTAAAAIWGRLCASQAFVGSFPMFT